MEKLVVQMTSSELTELVQKAVAGAVSTPPPPRVESPKALLRPPVKTTGTRLLNLTQLSEQVGLSRPTLRGMIEHGMPCVTVPGTTRRMFVLDDVVAWIRAHQPAA